MKRNRGISQDPFLVLWRTAMPAVLVECGFMSNTSDLAAMRGEENQKKIAAQLYNAFVSFKKKYDASVGTQNVAAADQPAPASTPAAPQASAQEETAVQTPAAEATGQFGTQILASSKKMAANDKFFKGYTFSSVWTGKLYKYIIGVKATEAEAREEMKKIKKIFPDGFLVEIEAEDTRRIP